MFFAEIGGSVEDMKPEREEMVEDNLETNDGKEGEEAGSSKRSLGENDYMKLTMSFIFDL